MKFPSGPISGAKCGPCGNKNTYTANAVIIAAQPAQALRIMCAIASRAATQNSRGTFCRNS
jgi:hypothetical protein